MFTKKISYIIGVPFILIFSMISCDTDFSDQDEIYTNEFDALPYIPMTEGLGLQYSVSDTLDQTNSNILVVTQNGGMVDNLFTFNFIDSEIDNMGSRFHFFETDYWTSSSHQLYRYGGYIGSLAHYYSGFSIPVKFKHEDQWERGWFGVSLAYFNCQYIGSYSLDGNFYEDCFKINIDATDTVDEYLSCSGYYIITPDIGILEINLVRTNETEIVFKYNSSQTYTKQIVSGTIKNYEDTPDLYVGLSEYFIAPVDMSTGVFSCEVYGPIATLLIGHDINNDNRIDTEDDSIRLSYFIDDVENADNLIIDMDSL